MNPSAGAPSSIQYQVCGNTIGTVCAASIPYCATVTASIVPTLSATITPENPVLCTSNPTLTASPTGGQAPYTYLWSGPSNNGATTSSILPTVEGTYSVSISDASGCPPITISTTVSSAPVTTGSSDQVRCLNQNSLATSFISSDVNTTFSWTNDNTNTGIPANGSGNLISYPLIGTGNSTITVTPTLYGCVGTPSTFTITVNGLPIVEAGPDQFLCSNSTTNVTATGASTYAWMPNVLNGIDFTVTTSGIYTVTGTDVNGCQNTDDLSIVFDNTPPTASNIPGQTYQCLTNVPAPDVNLVSDEADNYGTPTVAWLSDVLSGSCPKTLTRTYKVTDSCDNFTNVSQIFTISPSTNPVVPANGGSTISCPDQSQIQPTAPNVTDVCGNSITPIVTSSNNISCEGTKTWTFTYIDCAGNSSTWNYIYTIDYSGGLTAPASGSSTVSCPNSAINPGPPSTITDACGRTVNAALIGSSQTTNPVTCEGTIVWTYRYTACDGTTTADWTYTYTIDYSNGLIAPANTNSTVSCPSAAINPGAPNNITDVCGRIVTPLFIGQDSPSPSCEGLIVWRYRYTACDGTTSVDWTHTYTINYSGGLTTPQNGSSTISCPVEAVNPGAPSSIVDACGRTVIPVLIGQDAATPSCQGNVVWRYRYTACDGTTADWIYTYTIDLPIFNLPSNGSSNVSCISEINTSIINPPIILYTCGNIINPTGPIIQDSPNPIICSGTRNFVYTYTDCAGNSLNWVFSFIINDNIPPAASNLPNVDIECIEDIPLPNIALLSNATDNCSIESITWQGDIVNNDFCPKVLRTYKISDACNNFIEVTQLFNVVDNPLCI